MTLQIVCVPIDPRGLAAYAVANECSDDDGGYALHRALRERFSGAGPQPFRFVAEHRRGPHLLGYAADPQALSDAAALPATDALLRRVFSGPPEAQDMPGEWREGARYAFEVRARPVVRYGGRVRAARATREGAWLTGRAKPAQEVDAFVAACERAGEDASVDRAAVYHEWLARQLAAAATLEDEVELRLFRRIRTWRSTHGRGGKPWVEGPEAVLGGTLVVRDPAAFGQALKRGIGRHTAFGFGMLLLSAPRRAG